MLIAEELFLLLCRDDGKAESAFAADGYGLSAAVIADLVLAERVTLSEEKHPRLTVVPDRPTDDPVLDPALARLQERNGKRLSSLVTDRKLNPKARVAQALEDAGILDIEEKRALGFIPEKYPVRNPGPEREVRDRLRTVLAGGTPTAHDGPLLAILQGLDLAAKVLEQEKGELTTRQLKQRIGEVSEEVVVGPAVAAAVQALNVAIVTAAIVPAASS